MNISTIVLFFFLSLSLSQIHCWDDGTPIEETLRALNDLIVCGKIHYIGVSNVTGWQFQKIIDTCHHLGLNQIVSNQVGNAMERNANKGRVIIFCLTILRIVYSENDCDSNYVCFAQ